MAEAEILEESKRDDAGSSTTDLLVAVPGALGSDIFSSTLKKLADACRLLTAPCEVVLALPVGTAQDQLAERPRELPTDLARTSPQAHPLRYVNYPVAVSDSVATPWLTSANTNQAIFSLANKLGARACTVLGTDAAFQNESITAEKLTLLLGPGMEGRFDLVMPLYTMQPFDDLLNKSILYPLTRALYGQRVRNPLGNEFQVSVRLLQKISSNAARDSARQQARLLWLASIAANQNLKICQVHLGAKRPPSHEGIELSGALAQLAGPLFTDMEDNAAFWQRVRGSHEVPTFGNAETSVDPVDAVDVSRMVDAFQLGMRNLREIWSLILPPVTLLELMKLSRLSPDEFQMPGALWARIVYDFALAHRLRNIHRTHLFGALTPLYLGWAASYAVELNRAGMAVAEERVEQLAIAYEAEKPYLLSRWRWPDRFHP